MSSDSILSEKRGPVGLLTINRPKTLNAIDVPTMHALDAALSINLSSEMFATGKKVEGRLRSLFGSASATSTNESVQ